MRPGRFRRCNEFLAAAALALMPLAAPAPEQQTAGRTIETALAQAQARRQPVLVDVHAPWCHSCYFMQKNVMHGAEWDDVKKRAVVAELDGDSPEGARWVQQWKVGGYPSYLVLNEQGAEIGRILGDRPRAKFYEELRPLLARGATLDALKAQVKDADAASVEAARAVLRSYYERQAPAEALDWEVALPPSVRAALAKDAEISDRLARLRLHRAAAVRDAVACAERAPPVLARELSCDRLGEVIAYQECLSERPAAERRAKLAQLKPRLQRLQNAVLVKRSETCNDDRGIVQTAAELYEAIGDKAAFDEVVAQGIAYTEGGLAGDVARDRNLADNLRFYLELAKDDGRLDALYAKLIPAYPDDYVYAFRYGRTLVQRGEAARALPYLEQSFPKSYGRNRLWVAEWRAKALVALKRDDEARAVVSETLAANGPWFADDAARLKAVVTK